MTTKSFTEKAKAFSQVVVDSIIGGNKQFPCEMVVDDEKCPNEAVGYCKDCKNNKKYCSDCWKVHSTRNKTHILVSLTGDQETSFDVEQSADLANPVVGKLRKSDRLKALTNGFTKEEYRRFINMISFEDKMKEELFQGTKEDDVIPFKLIIVPLNNLLEDNLYHTIYNKVVKLVAQGQQFGLTHTALQIGSKIIDWHNGEIIYPRPLASNAFVVLDIKKMLATEIKNTSQFQKRICETIIYYNRNVSYSNKENNCQKFVSDVFESLGVHPKYPKNIEKYLLDVRLDIANGEPHYIDPESKKKRVFFDSHKDLDDYYDNHWKEMSEDDFTLFKAFDRAFQLRYEKTQDQKYFVEKCALGKITGL